MNIFSIIMWSGGVVFVLYMLYVIAHWASKNVEHWVEKLNAIKERETALEKKEQNLTARSHEQNNIVWREKNKAIEQYEQAVSAIKISESMRKNTQDEIDKLRKQIKELEKQLHQARQRGIRLADKAKNNVVPNEK